MIQFYTACMAGPYHIDNGIPCQDACRVERREDGVVFAACADGVGSERFADVGAQCGVRAAVDHCRAHYRVGMTPEEARSLLRDTFYQGYKAVVEEAQRAGNPIDQYDSTLCMAILDGDRVHYGQAGDSGLVALLRDGRYLPVTVQQRSEEGAVYPLCAGPARWAFGTLEEPVSALMLMTDGVWDQICHPLLKRCAVQVNVSLARQFLERTEDTPQAVKALEAAVTGYLEDYPRTHLDDDKTMVVLYDPETPPARQPEDYYAPPDWESLYQAALRRRGTPEEETMAAGGEEGSRREDGREEAGPRKDAGEASAPEDKASGAGAGENPPSADPAGSAAPKRPKAETAGTRSRRPPAPMPLALPGETPPAAETARERDAADPPRQETGTEPDPKPPPRRQGGHRANRGKARGKAGALPELLPLALLLGAGLLAWRMSGFVKAHAPTGYLGVALVCFIANAAVLLPAPSLLAVLAFARVLDPAAVAVWGAAGAALGETVGFFTGRQGGRLLDRRWGKRLEKRVPRRPYLLVTAFAALPLPLFDAVGLMAGAAGLPLLRFYLACFAGKLVKMGAAVGLWLWARAAIF